MFTITPKRSVPGPKISGREKRRRINHAIAKRKREASLCIKATMRRMERNSAYVKKCRALKVRREAIQRYVSVYLFSSRSIFTNHVMSKDALKSFNRAKLVVFLWMRNSMFLTSSKQTARLLNLVIACVAAP